MPSWLERMIQEFERASQEPSTDELPGGGGGEGPEPGWDGLRDARPGAEDTRQEYSAPSQRESKPSEWGVWKDPIASEALWQSAMKTREDRRRECQPNDWNALANRWFGDNEGVADESRRTTQAGMRFPQQEQPPKVADQAENPELGIWEHWWNQKSGGQVYPGLGPGKGLGRFLPMLGRTADGVSTDEVWNADRGKAGQRLLEQYADKITEVEQRRGIPPGILGAVVWHEGPGTFIGPHDVGGLKKTLDELLARAGRDSTTIGLGEVGVDTAQFVENKDNTLPKSKSREETIEKLLNPETNIEYMGAYLGLLYRQIDANLPYVPERQKWELAVIAYNVGLAGLESSGNEQGYRGAVGDLGTGYQQQTLPYVSYARRLLYGY